MSHSRGIVVGWRSRPASGRASRTARSPTSTRRGRRLLPIHDAGHVRNAFARFDQVRFEDDAARDRARKRLLNAARKFGIVPVGFIEGQLRSARQARSAAAGRLPTGAVTFLLTDIEQSTALLARLGDGYVRLLRDVRGMVRQAVRDAGGYEVDSHADGFFAAFRTALPAHSGRGRPAAGARRPSLAPGPGVQGPHRDPQRAPHAHRDGLRRAVGPRRGQDLLGRPRRPDRGVGGGPDRGRRPAPRRPAPKPRTVPSGGAPQDRRALPGRVRGAGGRLPAPANPRRSGLAHRAVAGAARHRSAHLSDRRLVRYRR